MKRSALFRNTAYRQPLLLLVQHDVWGTLQQIHNNHSLAKLGTQLDYWLNLANEELDDNDEWLEVFHEQLQRLIEALSCLLQQRTTDVTLTGKLKMYSWLTGEEVQHPEQVITEFCRFYNQAHATALCWYWLDAVALSLNLTPHALQSLLPDFELVIAMISAAYGVS